MEAFFPPVFPLGVSKLLPSCRLKFWTSYNALLFLLGVGDGVRGSDRELHIN